MKLFAALLILSGISTFATAAPLSVADIKSRLELKSDIYTLDSSGKVVISGPNETSTLRATGELGVLNGSYSVHFGKNHLFYQVTWKVQDDGTHKLLVEEYQDGGGRKKFTGLLEKKEFVIENFEPVTWRPKNKNPENLLVRFIPSLREVSKPVAMDELPISGTHMVITDSQGYMWADDVEFNAKYSGIKTHRGSLVLSFTPFKGSKELGVAEGREIVLNPEKNFKIRVASQTDFLPNGLTAKVYGLYDLKNKSERLNSVHSWGSSNESRIEEGFRN